MIDINKQISYWRDGAEENFELAAHLVDRGNIREGLFFAHLSLEKMLKAHVWKATRDYAPKIHALLRLAEKAMIELPQAQREVLAIMTEFCLEGRYPDSLTEPPAKTEALNYLKRSEEALKWLKNQL